MIQTLKDRLARDRHGKPACIVDDCEKHRDTELYCSDHDRLADAVEAAHIRIEAGAIQTAHLLDCQQCGGQFVDNDVFGEGPGSCPSCGNPDVIAIELTPTATPFTNV